MEEFKNLQETKLTSQPIFDGDVLHIYKDTVRLPNGKTSTREYTVHHGAVCILPLLENGDVLLERQFRYAMGEVLTEIPAGKLDYIGEDPREAALRELREETGAVASELIPLGPFYPTCAYSTEVIQMFLARGLSFGERELDEDEFLNVFRLPLRELVEKVLNGEIPDAKTQAAALRAWCMLQEGSSREAGAGLSFVHRRRLLRGCAGVWPWHRACAVLHRRPARRRSAGAVGASGGTLPVCIKPVRAARAVQ